MTGTAALLDENDLACSSCGGWSCRPAARPRPASPQLERAGVRGAIIDGVLAAMRRAGELG